MGSNRIEDYVEKVYGYAVNRTYTQDEADELAQEILLTAVKELPKLREASRFEPWLWGVAANVTKSFRRSLGKQRAMYSYDTLETLSYEDTYSCEQEEINDHLRKRIAMLSATYREIIVLFYYDSLSTKEISEKLNIPEGTIRWRLTEARKKLKKECEKMQETALRPVTLRLDIYGQGNYDGKTVPFPTAYIDDSLSQNILYRCYEQALSVEELAKVCGVAAYYVEERIANLIKREAMIEQPKGKYRTNFIIWSDKYGIYCEENAEKALMPIMDRVMTALEKIAKDAAQIDFYKAGKSENDLFYLYGAMAFSYARERYCDLPYPRFKKRYDGFEWNYLGSVESGAHPRLSMGVQHSANRSGLGRFSHTAYNFGLKTRRMMYDNYINACESLLYKGGCEDVLSVASAIEDGYIVKKEDGSFFVTMPSFTLAQYNAFTDIVSKHLAPLMPDYSQAVRVFVDGYKALFPKHVSDDADRMCQGMFSGLYAAVVAYGLRTNRLPAPTGDYCGDVMVEHKKQPFT